MFNLASIQRLSHKCMEKKVPVLPSLLQLVIFLCYSSNVHYKVRIGKGTFFNHLGFGVLINSSVVIGDNCKIGNNVSIVGQGPYKNAPKIGNRVYIGPGAVVQGPVLIEDNVIIAPNSVVNKSVPENAIVAGNPAKIIGWTDRLDYDIFADESWKDGYRPFLASN